jgi:AsmA protein
MTPRSRDPSLAICSPAGHPVLIGLRRTLTTSQLRSLRDRVRLVQPAFHFEVDKLGRRNWIFGLAARPQSVAAPAEPAPGITLAVANLILVHGTADYFDQRTGAKQGAADLNFSGAMPGPSEPVTAEGTAAWNGREVNLALAAASPAGLWQGETSALAFRLRSSLLAADFTGKLSAARPAEAIGGIRISTLSLRSLGKWLGLHLAAPGTGFGPLSLTAAIDATRSRVTLTEARISLDDNMARGIVALDTRGKRPALSGRLEFATLDLNPYVKPPRARSATPVAAVAHGARGGTVPGSPVSTLSSGWSQAAIDLSPLRRLNADLSLDTGAIVFRDIKLGKSAVDVHLNDGKLVLKPSGVTLYRGHGSGEIVADASGPAASIAVGLDLRGIEAGPLLSDVGGFDQLTGSGEILINLRGYGRNSNEIVASLSGDCRISLTNGKYTSADFTRLLKNIPWQIDRRGQDFGDITFSSLSASGTIRSGIVKNDDLKLASSEMSVAGSGTIDLTSRSLDYELAANVAVMGSARIHVAGSWADPTYKIKSVSITRPFPGPGRASGGRDNKR